MTLEEIAKLVETHLPGYKLLAPEEARGFIPFDAPEGVICPSYEKLRQDYLDRRLVDQEKLLTILRPMFPIQEPEVEVNEDPECPNWITACISCYLPANATVDEAVRMHSEIHRVVRGLDLVDQCFWRFSVNFSDKESVELSVDAS